MLYPPKETLLFLSERFWMKKAFSRGAGVCIYVKPRKKSYSTKDPLRRVIRLWFRNKYSDIPCFRRFL